MELLRIVGKLIAVGTKWENDTHLEIHIPDHRSEVGVTTLYIPCTKDQAAAFGKLLYQDINIVVSSAVG